MDSDTISLCFILILVYGLIIAALVSEIKKKKGNNIKNKNTLSGESKEKMDYILDYIKIDKGLNSYEISYEECSDISIFDSKLGGVPYWDLKKEYPCNSDGKKLVLLMQINFEEEKNIEDELLPQKGILQFFIDTDELNGLDDKKGAKVIYHEKIDHSLTKEDIERLEIKTSLILDDNNEEFFPFKGEYKVKFENNIDHSLGTRTNIANKIKEVLKEKYNDTRELTFIEDYFTEKEYDYLYENIDASGSKLLGYAEFTQDDPRNMEEYKDYSILLLQLDSEGPMIWGDSGICNFFIKKEDLMKRKFDDVLYNWDCM